MDKRGHESISQKSGRAVHVFPARVDTDISCVFRVLHHYIQASFKARQRGEASRAVNRLVFISEKGVFVTENALLCTML